MRMEKENSEKRMYVLTCYNISEIQKGIQAAHTIAELGVKMWRTSSNDNNKYLDWVDNWKTIIVLNGGTTNNDKENKWYGTLQQHRDRLVELGVTISEFYEPDLNDALTAVAFIVDMEKDWMISKYLQNEKLA